MSSIATASGVGAHLPGEQPALQALNIRKELLIQAPPDLERE